MISSWPADCSGSKSSPVSGRTVDVAEPCASGDEAPFGSPSQALTWHWRSENSGSVNRFTGIGIDASRARIAGVGGLRSQLRLRTSRADEMLGARRSSGAEVDLGI
jgi:hypothetical protein